MSTVLTVLIAILLFSFLIFIHEFGHFITAKLFKVRVNEFSMFMGPAIFKKKWGETEYTLRCIPLGGYCAMEGEDGDSDDPRAFSKAAWWKRLIILVAGATMNFIAGLLLLAIVYAPAREFVVPVVSYVEPNCSLAEGIGIMEGDRILSVDGERIYVQSDFTMLLSLNPGDTHDLTVERDGLKIDLPGVRTEMREFEEGQLRYGFNFSMEEATFASRVRYVWNSGLNAARLVKLSLKMLLNGQAGLKDVGGPVMIVQQMAETASASKTSLDALYNLLYFGAFIAINLAVMNLLPIPALDGGRAVCLLLTTAVEAVIRRKIDPKYEAYLHAAGLIILLAFMAIITFKDIFNIFRG